MASANKATILDQLQETATRIKQYILQQIADLSEAVMAAIPETYAGSAEAGGVANKTAAIPYGHVDSSSTATAYTATIDGITELVDGTTVLLKNGVVTSKAGFTIDINGLGAKPVYNSMAAASAETTIFNVAYTLLLVYDSTRVSGGCWINYRGYYSDANTVPTGYCTTAAGTAAKVATCNYGYRDDDNYFPCLFRYENTAANATLAISSYATTAAPIYVNGARTSANNTFGRGVILFLYHDGAYYTYNDGRFPIVVDGAVTSVQEYVAAKYTKPSDGIPRGDLGADVQASLADSELIASIASSCAGQRVTEGTQIQAKFTARKTCAPVGFFYNPSTDDLSIYVAFALQDIPEIVKRRYYVLFTPASAGEPVELTAETAGRVNEVNANNANLYAYKARFTTFSATRTPLDVRFLAVALDANGQEIDRVYSAQYRYELSNGAVTRTRFQTAPTAADHVVEIGLIENDLAVAAKYGDIASLRPQDTILSLIGTEEPASYRFVIPDSAFDAAPLGMSLAVVSGTNILHRGANVLKATELSSLPAVTSADNGKVLTVVDGAWAADALPVYNGELG